MKHLIVLVISVLTIHVSHAQINEIGIYVGGSNFIGDLGSTKYIAPNAPALGFLYKWNASSRHSWRASVIYSDLKAMDVDADDPRRIQRGYEFDSNLLEVSLGMEFTFTEFNLHNERKIGAPYLHTGLVATKFDNYYYPANGIQTSENVSSWTLGIPMTLGYKATFIDNIVIGVEVGARYTFTDEIEGSTPSEASNQPYRFGNINNNDWYMFSGITLTYTFGENPCYCVN
ncbi:hypothetical protein FUA26_15310 [Seonamhaeicola algicola]|uniref:DUF6089 domain-containing protein n=1 Tax=Seonamhaeicola algicola TaxID=1719036 RepID=A0A5C7AID9_9FLAO|nr:DUF6089 family protein [Seonamhaeicola algicola]TXE06335.1 hypothetical protein FUA26_15310 [Seonamhaeicola algicola]